MSYFIDDRLPAEIEVGAKARPRYKTDIVTADSGYEVRNSRWSAPLFQFEFNVEPGTRIEGEYDTLDEFLDMFHACGGSAGAFRFGYWRDKPVVNQQIGTGDGVTTAFQLYREYTKGALTRRRKITRPVEGTVSATVDGVAAAGSVDPDTGIITLNSAPALGAVVRASFTHDVPVRFADDELEAVGLSDQLDQIVNIVLLEIRE